ncbi:putative threonine aldolase [Neoconidiobolus thromboides FSU 785]|nr:putative threonine aldolase [Neoconidiobolus thromboides FSU 785]
MTLTQSFRQGPPAKVGDSIEDIETPALVVELEAFENNLKKMVSLVEEESQKINHSIRIRPHFKTHKCPSIASIQKKLGGASGICCAKITEAESLIYGSKKDESWDLLITNSIVSDKKLQRLVKLSQAMKEKKENPLLAVCVDDVEHIKLLKKHYENTELELNYYIEVNVGQDRGGVDEPEEVLEIVKLANEIPCLHFKGIHAYNGSNQHVRSYDERRNTVLGPLVKGKLEKCIELLKENNINVDTITGGGTGSFQFEIQTGIYHEVQVGSYLFMDVDYADNYDVTYGEKVNSFEHSLFIYSKIQSQRADTTVSPRLIIDAGLKSLSLDSGLPKVVVEKGEQPLRYISQGDEHGQIVPDENTTKFQNPKAYKFGQIIKLIPGHCDPTFNMHDYVVAVKGGKVEHVWPIEGRGPGH